MKIRVVQIWGFLMTVLGWIFVACTMAMEGWKITSIGGMGGSSIIKVAWYWSSLWRSCFTDSTAVSNCYDYPVLWSVEGRWHILPSLSNKCFSRGLHWHVDSHWCLFASPRLHPDRARPADDSSFPGHAGLCAQPAGDGVHLHRGKGQIKVQEDLRWWMVPHYQR